MNTLSRKQNEMREREARILELARRYLQQGYHNLSMHQIARDLQYSTGTIYNHFKNKEEIVIALVIQTMKVRVDLFRRARDWKALPRERLQAIGIASELFVQLYPDYFNVEQLVRSDALWEKTSEERRHAMHSCESGCIGVVAGVVSEGVQQGQLTLPNGFTCEDLVFGLWSLHYGAFTIMATSSSLDQLGIKDPRNALHVATNSLLDGYGFKPLSSEYDYHAVRERIRLEVFPHEFEQVEGC
ncbi:MAG: TetR/AcrR family transcriptional regulator [Gemmataceae bacterium]